MKKILLTSILGTALLLSSCGKKITASFGGASYPTSYKKSLSATQSTPESNVAEEVVTASTEEVKVEKITKGEFKQKVSGARAELKNLDVSKMSEKQQKLVKKLDRKLEKLEKKAEKKGSGSDLMRIGIILAIAGLAGLLIGAILGIGILWQLGALCLVIGFCLIVYDLIANS